MINIDELRSMVNATQFESFANSVINSLLDRLEAAEARVTGARPSPSINPASLYAVINWLRNGCDPRKAADELEMFAATLEAKP